MKSNKYFDRKTNYSHGIMFHHFHDRKIHKPGQGSISKKDFVKIINFIGRKNILDAEEYILRYKNKTLKKNHVCFSFDDGCLSQFDVALPVLEKYKIKSFFFVYSSMFTKKPDLLEIYRYFRINYFSSVDDFYNNFFKKINKNYISYLEKNKRTIKIKKKIYPHYSINDIKFRLVRNFFLTKKQYQQTMNKLFIDKKFKPQKFFKNVFINEKQLKKIYEQGHSIGLHSHSHPTVINNLNYSEQLYEYKKNIEIFSNILNCSQNNFKSMSHPCGRYDENTVKILKKLKIDVGFIATMKDQKKGYQFYNIPRQDHADIMKKIKSK